MAKYIISFNQSQRLLPCYLEIEITRNGTVAGSHRVVALWDQKTLPVSRWRGSGDVDF